LLFGSPSLGLLVFHPRSPVRDVRDSALFGPAPKAIAGCKPTRVNMETAGSGLKNLLAHGRFFEGLPKQKDVAHGERRPQDEQRVSYFETRITALKAGL